MKKLSNRAVFLPGRKTANVNVKTNTILSL